MKWVAAVVAASLVLAAVTLTITPSSHDHGDQGVNIGGNFKVFDVTLPTGAGAGDTLDAQIQGADASEFSVDRGTVGMQLGNYQSTCINGDDVVGDTEVVWSLTRS